MDRRDLAALLPLLGIVASGQESAALPSRMFRYEDLPVRPSGNGKNKSRPVFDGRTSKGMRVEMHETELGPRMAPHPPHTHVHEELIVVREGSVEVTISGKSQLLGPGGVAYVASNELHGWVNAGDAVAKYYIITLRG